MPYLMLQLVAYKHSESHNPKDSALQMPVCLLNVHWHFVAGTACTLKRGFPKSMHACITPLLVITSILHASCIILGELA